MKMITISDVHVRNANDDRYKYLLNFVEHDEVLKSDVIIFLGDIFDVLVGSYNHYIVEYQDFFKKISILSQTKKIYYFQGNHDFHLDKLFKKIEKKFGLKKENFSLIKNEHVFSVNEKKIRISHGDEVNLYDPDYLKFRAMIQSKWTYFIVHYMMSYSCLMKLANKLSDKSKNHYQKDFKLEMTKINFRNSYKQVLSRESSDILICGHSHVIDNCTDEVNGKTLKYFNAGFYPVDKKVIIIDNLNISFLSIEAS